MNNITNRTVERTNAALLHLKPCVKEWYSMECVKEETVERFFCAVKQLQPDGFLGWQMEFAPGEKPAFYAFSGANVHTECADFDWMFCPCAEVKPTEPVAWPFVDGHWVYELRSESKGDDKVPRSNKGFVDDTPLPYCRYLAEALLELSASKTILRLTAGNNCGRVLLGMSDEMSLRLRVMLSMAFPNLVLEETGAAEDAGKLAVLELSEQFGDLLGAALYLYADEPTPIPDIVDATDDEKDCALTDTTSIESLDFSVRTYNCLKRAGITSVEKLRMMSDEDLFHIRNLSRKCIAEIRQKAGEYGALAAVPAPLDAASYSDMLNDLIGLQSVKQQVRRIAAYARMQQDMAAQGRKRIPVVLNMEFVGNPGTAKTTVARIVAGMLHEVGLLASNELVEVGRAELVAKYVGQTASQVKSVFQKAKGKLLFVDEAYSLSDDSENSYGDEALSAIVQEMENNREDTVVIFAGYPDKMAELFSRNPGLRSRVPFHIDFPDYQTDELLQIAEREAERRGFSVCPEAREKLRSVFTQASRRPDMGNGRFCRNLVEDAILNYALRVYGSENADMTGGFALTTDDFAAPERTEEASSPMTIGF